MYILTGIAVCVLFGAVRLWQFLRVPSSFPRDIPRIPLYVIFLAMWWDLSNFEVYNRWIREPMEKHGAVILWFADRWNVIMAQPDLVVDLLRNSAIYIKAGNQVRAPYGALGTFVGDNIVNSEGANHRLYKAVMQSGIQRRFDAAPFVEKSRILADRLIASQRQVDSQQGISVMPWLQRFTVDMMSVSFLGFDMKTLDGAPMDQLITRVKLGVFSRAFMAFPSLDRLRWFLPWRRRVFQLIREFDHALYTTVRRHTSSGVKGTNTVVSQLLESALTEGKITDTQFRANLTITLMVGHDNAEFFLASSMMVLGQNQDIQDRLRAEAMNVAGEELTADTFDNLPYLTSFIYEVLRLYPPVAQMMNRISTGHTLLGGRIPIQPRTSVGWTAYGVHTNSHAWGPTARDFMPERWGSNVREIQSTVRRQTVRGNYIPFNAYARKCLGQDFALLEVKVVLCELVRRIRWTVDPLEKIKMSHGSLTFPVGLKVNVEELSDADFNKS